MHDIKDIRKRPEYYKEGIVKRGTDPEVIDTVIELDEALRKKIGERQVLAEKVNKFSALMGELKKLDKEIEAEDKRIAELDRQCDEALLAAIGPYAGVIEQIVNELKQAETEGKSNEKPNE